MFFSKHRMIKHTALSAAMLMSLSTQAATTPLGNITDTTATYGLEVVSIGLLGLGVNPTDVTFSLSNPTDLTIDLTQLLGLSLGSNFKLTNTDTNTFSEFAAPLLSLGGTTSQSFGNIAAGNYKFTLAPAGLLSVGLAYTIKFTAVSAVPEPASGALMFAGLGMLGMALYRKQSQPS